MGNIIGNGGYLVGLLEYGVTDMWWLRIFAMCGCSGIVGWQLLQPRVQATTASWNILYFVINAVMLSRIKTDIVPEPSLEEAGLYESLACDFHGGLTKRQFRDLMDTGEFIWLVDGFQLSEGATRQEGDSDRCLFLITHGVCEVLRDGMIVAQLGPGCAVGEVGVLADTMMSGATVRASGSVRCFAAPAKRVQELLDADPAMENALDSVFTQSLTSKLASMNGTAKIRNYRAILEVACIVSSEPGVAASVRMYRAHHDVSEHSHDLLLEELPQCSHRPFRGRGPLSLSGTPGSEAVVPA